MIRALRGYNPARTFGYGPRYVTIQFLWTQATGPPERVYDFGA
jgi:hypothetical protein